MVKEWSVVEDQVPSDRALSLEKVMKRRMDVANPLIGRGNVYWLAQLFIHLKRSDEMLGH